MEVQDSVAAVPVAWSCAQPPAASQSRLSGGGQGFGEVVRESIPHARPLAAGRSRLPVVGQCSVEVVHASELPVRQPPQPAGRPEPAAGWQPVQCRGRLRQRSSCAPAPRSRKLLKAVADARAVEGPALSVDEPSKQSKSVAYAREVESLCFYRLACFRFAAGKAKSPVVHDVKQSKSVADARAVEGPA